MSFNLEKAILLWRKDLRKFSGIEPGDLEELETHLRDTIDDLVGEGMDAEEAFRRTVEEKFGEIKPISEEFYRARRKENVNTIQIANLNPLYMLPMNFKIAYRNLVRNRFDSILNITGLTLSITASILIYQYVIFETSYDGFFPQKERIYRVSAQSLNMDDGSLRGKYAATFYAVAPDIKREIPEVEASTRLYPSMGVLSKGEDHFREFDMYYTESTFFDVFSYPLLRGKPSDMDLPNVIFLSESMADKYFGSEDPIGKKLEYNLPGLFVHEVEVRGIYRDIPDNSHMHLNGLMSLTTFARGIDSNNIYGERRLEDVRWRLSAVFQYVLLKEGVDLSRLQPKLDAFIGRHRGKIDEARGVKNTFFLEALNDIHLSEELNWEMQPKGDKDIIFFLDIIFVVILVLGWINYVNLSTAKSITRAKEVGVRKIMGSSKKQLIYKFIAESLMVNFIAITLSGLLVLLLIPYYHQLVSKEVFKYFPDTLGSWDYFILVLFAGVLISSFYPALVLSSFKPVAILKGKFKSSGKGVVLRKGLVTLQFCLSLIMLVGIYVLYEQLQFMRNYDLGFSLNETLVLRAPSSNDSLTNSQLRVFREVIASESGINDVTVSSTVPGNEIPYRTGARNLSAGNKRQDLFVSRIFAYDNFMEFYDLKLIAGRVFSQSRPADQFTVVLNRQAVQLFGFETPEEALHKQIAYTLGDTLEIIGVVENYAQRGLQVAYDPTGFQLSRDGSGVYISIDVKRDYVSQKMDFLEETYSRFFPRDPYEYFFLDEYYGRQYQSEEKYGKILGLFTIVAIVIASLGLLGLTSFMVRLKLKEVAIRKVLGATITHIFGLLTREYIYLISLACLIGIPVTYYGAGVWLNNFAFKVTLEPVLFVLPVLVMVIIIFITIGRISLKAAHANPVDSLKEE